MRWAASLPGLTDVAPTRGAAPSSPLLRAGHIAQGRSPRDVQLLAGHRSIETTQGYIDGDTDGQRRLVSIIWSAVRIRHLQGIQCILGKNTLSPTMNHLSVDHRPCDWQSSVYLTRLLDCALPAPECLTHLQKRGCQSGTAAESKGMYGTSLRPASPSSKTVSCSAPPTKKTGAAAPMRAAGRVLDDPTSDQDSGPRHMSRAPNLPRDWHYRLPQE